MPPRSMREGRAARGADREGARRRSRRWSAPRPANVTFTSGGTEANMLALTPRSRPAGEDAARPAVRLGDRASLGAQRRPFCRRRGRGIAGRQPTASSISQRSSSALARAERPLVSVMLANNETGVIQPIARIADIVHAAERRAACRCRAGAGPHRLRHRALGADLLTLSVAQARRPAGRRRAHPPRRHPYRRAADQGRRPGARPARRHRERRGHRRLRRGCAAAAGGTAGGRCPHGGACATGSKPAFEAATPDAVIFGAERARGCPTRRLFAVPGMKAETAMIAFDLDGVAVSSGSACSSGKVAGLARAGGDGRCTRSWRAARCASASAGRTTEADVERFLECLEKAVSITT